MKKSVKKLLIAISCICVAVVLVGVGILVYIERGVQRREAKFIPLIVSRAENAYNEEASFENLYALCDNLTFSGEDEKIIQYMPKIFLDTQNRSRFESEEKMKINYDLFVTAHLVSVYRLHGAEQMKAQLEEYGALYFFPQKASVYLLQFAEYTAIPQQENGWLEINSVFFEYARQYGTDSDKNMAKTAYEQVQRLAQENA